MAELLNPDDTRWLDFGLEMPGKLSTPAPPAGLSVATSLRTDATVAADPNTVNVLVTCDASPFATRYRFRMRIAGLLGSNYELVASTTEPMAQVAVPANATVEFIVQAVNGNRQSVASEAVVFTAPAAAAPSTAKRSDATAREQITPAAAPVADGHANGNRLPALS